MADPSNRISAASDVASESDREEAYATVCARAVRLLELLQPWAEHGQEASGACALLTLALARIPLSPEELQRSEGLRLDAAGTMADVRHEAAEQRPSGNPIPTTMLRNVWKFKLPEPSASGRVSVDMPADSVPLSAGLQGDAMVVWALVGSRGEWPSYQRVSRRFIVANTGTEIPDFPEDARFLGTVTSSTGIVWHVWHEPAGKRRPLRRCPHGVQVGPLDDYGLPDEVEVSPYSAYCWICNGEEAATAQFPEPAASAEETLDAFFADATVAAVLVENRGFSEEQAVAEVVRLKASAATPPEGDAK